VSADRFPSHSEIREVGPRDGLQDETPLSVDTRIEIIDALSATGLRAIEVGSFVRADVVPAMADTDQVLAGIERRKGVRYRVLVPNVRGAELALGAGADELQVVVSVSSEHNHRNLGMSVADSVGQIRSVVEMASQEEVEVEVIVATAFGCVYQGRVPPTDVVELSRRVRDAGVTSFSFADTIGSATPLLVTGVIDALESAGWVAGDIALHLHNTRGSGLANILIAAQHGVSRFDASVGGLGGCNFSPGATGNVPTEDVIHLLDSLGASTGVDVEAVISIALRLETLIGRRLPGCLMRTGPGAGDRR
jgi:hydroxymethylglutaryl-CoA lyase